MMVEARFVCQSRTDYGHSWQITLQADTKSQEWAMWTPGGTLTFTATKPEVAASFVVGKTYKVLMEPIEG